MCLPNGSAAYRLMTFQPVSRNPPAVFLKHSLDPALPMLENSKCISFVKRMKSKFQSMAFKFLHNMTITHLPRNSSLHSPFPTILYFRVNKLSAYNLKSGSHTITKFWT